MAKFDLNLVTGAKSNWDKSKSRTKKDDLFMGIYFMVLWSPLDGGEGKWVIRMKIEEVNFSICWMLLT